MIIRAFGLPQYIKAGALIVMGLWFGAAHGATAVATVSATIVPPPEGREGLTLSAMQLHMTGKTNDEITIHNGSNYRRDIHIDLIRSAGSKEECPFRYSPATFSIPPGGYQVVRLVKLRKKGHSQHTEHRMEISNLQISAMPLFSVQVHTEKSQIMADE